jgi:hypothetical protein
VIVADSSSQLILRPLRFSRQPKRRTDGADRERLHSECRVEISTGTRSSRTRSSEERPGDLSFMTPPVYRIPTVGTVDRMTWRFAPLDGIATTGKTEVTEPYLMKYVDFFRTRYFSRRAGFARAGWFRHFGPPEPSFGTVWPHGPVLTPDE